MALATRTAHVRALPRHHTPTGVAAAPPVTPPARPPVTSPVTLPVTSSGAVPSWPGAARGLLADLAVAALAAAALAEHSERAAVPVDALPSARRASVLAEHLTETCARLRQDLQQQTLVVLPVLRTAPLGLRTAVVRASVERVLRQLVDVERATALLADGGACATDLRDLALALRSTRAAVAVHRRLWTAEAMPLARELLRERTAR